MNIPEDREKLEQLVIDYLYGNLNEAEQADFDKALAGNTLLQEIVAAERNLDKVIPRGTAVYIDDERMADSHRQLRRSLQKQIANRSVIGEFLRALLHRPSLVALQSVALAASYVLGFLIASPGTEVESQGSPAAGITTPLAMVGEQDYEIAEMHIDRFDPVSGDIELSFSIASDTRISGNVADSGIRTLMSVALLDEIDEAATLNTIEALQSASYDDEVSASLIHVLNNDGNPGARYQAVRSLIDHVDRRQVRGALRTALQQDVNPGVRVEAFNALAENPDAETLAVFQQRAEVDGNEYIRQRAREIVEAENTGQDNSAFF